MVLYYVADRKDEAYSTSNWMAYPDAYHRFSRSTNGSWTFLRAHGKNVPEL